MITIGRESHRTVNNFNGGTLRRCMVCPCENKVTQDGIVDDPYGSIINVQSKGYKFKIWLCSFEHTQTFAQHTQLGQNLECTSCSSRGKTLYIVGCRGNKKPYMRVGHIVCCECVTEQSKKYKTTLEDHISEFKSTADILCGDETCLVCPYGEVVNIPVGITCGAKCFNTPCQMDMDRQFVCEECHLIFCSSQCANNSKTHMSLCPGRVTRVHLCVEPKCTTFECKTKLQPLKKIKNGIAKYNNLRIGDAVITRTSKYQDTLARCTYRTDTKQYEFIVYLTNNGLQKDFGKRILDFISRHLFEPNIATYSMFTGPNFTYLIMMDCHRCKPARCSTLSLFQSQSLFGGGVSA